MYQVDARMDRIVPWSWKLREIERDRKSMSGWQGTATFELLISMAAEKIETMLLHDLVSCPQQKDCTFQDIGGVLMMHANSCGEQRSINFQGHEQLEERSFGT
jgi:hypothetical protein